MKTNELRIGNYVNIEGDVVKVKEIYEKSIHYTNGKYESYATEDFIQPIELTEEVLVKIGFKKETKMSRILYYLDYEINEDENIRARYVIYNSNALPLLRIILPSPIILECYELTKRGIKYLHELQNAYYLLTGQELNIEL